MNTKRAAALFLALMLLLGAGFALAQETTVKVAGKTVSATTQDLVLEKFDGYWGGAQPWNKVIRREIPNDAARVAQLKAGQVEYQHMAAQHMGHKQHLLFHVCSSVRAMEEAKFHSSSPRKHSLMA